MSTQPLPLTISHPYSFAARHDRHPGGRTFGGSICEPQRRRYLNTTSRHAGEALQVAIICLNAATILDGASDIWSDFSVCRLARRRVPPS